MGGSEVWLSANHLPAKCQVQHAPFHTWDVSCHPLSEVCNTNYLCVTCLMGYGYEFELDGCGSKCTVSLPWDNADWIGFKGQINMILKPMHWNLLYLYFLFMWDFFLRQSQHLFYSDVTMVLHCLAISTGGHCSALLWPNKQGGVQLY